MAAARLFPGPEPWHPVGVLISGNRGAVDGCTLAGLPIPGPRTSFFQPFTAILRFCRILSSYHSITVKIW